MLALAGLFNSAKINSPRPIFPHIMTRLYFLMCLLGCAVTGFATTLASVPLTELFQQADVVALVQVTQGQVLVVGEETCGARYEAQVLEGLKGAKQGSTIKFGHLQGYKIGAKYLLFLLKSGRSYDPKMSTNAIMEQAEQQVITKCSPVWRDLTVMHSGNGALPVSWASQFKYEDSVRIPSRFVGIPNGLNTKVAKASDDEELSSVLWVRLEDLLHHLRQLSSARPKTNKP